MNTKDMKDKGGDKNGKFPGQNANTVSGIQNGPSRSAFVRAAVEIVSEFPPEVAEPYLFLSELNGPASVDLKTALLRRNDFLSNNSEQSYVEGSGAVGGLAASIIVTLIVIAFRVLQLMTGGNAEGTAMTLALVVMFIAQIVLLCIVLGGILELEGFGIGAGILLTILYVAFLARPWAFYAMLGISLVLVIIMAVKIPREKASYRRSAENYQKEVDRAADRMFGIFRDNMYAFAAAWDGAPDPICQLRRIKADGYAKRMEEARGKIRDWRLEHRDWRFDLSPSWSDGTLAGKMKTSPSKKSLFGITLQDDMDVWLKWQDGVRDGDRQALDTFRRAALHGHARAMGCLGVYYGTTNQGDKNLLTSFFWTEAAVRAHRSVALTEGNTEEYCTDAIAFLGAHYLDGSPLIPKDTKTGRALMQWAAREGNSGAQVWLREHP